ncbi:XtrA/YqaO family protein [Gracilibacillus sp. D59]|uniref:XtrA/YqaO family protein n=1 Tax=Gracilibacillus sp. D59 TaxID=3457434 RepID=UPI003FCD72A5
MRLENVNIEDKGKEFNIKIPIEAGNLPFVVVYCNGIAKKTYLPSHGETKVITHQGKVKRVKFDEGEDF